MNNRIWRLLITLLLITLVDLLGWYASDKFLQWLQDAKPGEIFERPIVIVLYRVVFLAGGVLVGFLLGRFVFKRLESVGDRLRDMSGRDKIALGVGLAIGLVLTSILSLPLLQAISSKPLAGAISLVIGGVITYLTTAAALSMKEEIRFYMPPQQPEEEQLPKEKFKILDTNVIIDGRIADVARAGFLDGAIYIPGFVLDELQHIADSADGLKRARGRRGLDILNAMQKELTLLVRTYDRLVPGNEEVDARLVKLARALDGALVTNDFNLAKVAELQGVQVLNVNELANALKPIVLPGEILTVALVKEGREPSQAVGYLDDGTMIVVEGGRRHMGETVDVAVSSLLQTTAGKMIFAHLTEDEGDDDYGRNVRPYTGGGPRRPVRRRE